MARRGVSWTLVGLRDDGLPEFSFDGRGRGREGGREGYEVAGGGLTSRKEFEKH